MKLRALVRDHLGEQPGAPDVSPRGAAVVHDGAAWVLADERPGRALGSALAWARAQGAPALHVVADTDTGGLARRAAAFTDPPAVWRVEGRSLVAAEAEPLRAALPLDPRLLEFEPLIRTAGAEPVIEHGVLAGEVAGLEVCRAVLDPYAAGGARLEVGIGAHDREAFQLVHGDVPTADALAAVVAKVAAARQPGAAPHALNRLAGERALRGALVAAPQLVGARGLAPAPPPVPRTNVKDPTPCVAVGEGGDGAPVVVVCSVGIDLDLVPFAADARVAVDPDARLILAVPRRDAHPITLALAARLLRPAEVIPVAV